MTDISTLAQKLLHERMLTKEEFILLIENRDAPYNGETARALLKSCAALESRRTFGTSVFTRGLIEFTNYCKNNCYYCGIRAGNNMAERYRLTPEEILNCCRRGYLLDFRTFVLQGGEDPYFTDQKIAEIVQNIKKEFPDCAVTLSVGEHEYDTYKLWREAGTDRYLLRHETADNRHYCKLHPESMSPEHRKQCLYNLKKLGYQTGAGFMVGSPYQTTANLADDLLFLADLKPEMIGIGPFIHHDQTPFADKHDGSVELTLFLLSVLRIMFPDVLLPATTALGTLLPDGREQGILYGANVIMPNLSPVEDRKKYLLYNNKICTGEDAAECHICLAKRIASIGYTISAVRGDYHKLH
jgi:biotin synthase